LPAGRRKLRLEGTCGVEASLYREPISNFDVAVQNITQTSSLSRDLLLGTSFPKQISIRVDVVFVLGVCSPLLATAQNKSPPRWHFTRKSLSVHMLMSTLLQSLAPACFGELDVECTFNTMDHHLKNEVMQMAADSIKQVQFTSGTTSFFPPTNQSIIERFAIF
jgi:hypothetical protein